MGLIHLENEDEIKGIISDNVFVVVDFYSEECPPCEKLAPIFERLSQQYSSIAFIKIFRQRFRELAMSYGVSGSPTLLFFHRGVLQKDRLSGDIAELAFKAQLDAMLFRENLSREPAAPGRVIGKRDLCIIGTGPAGLSASIYASRYRLDHAIVGELHGGLMTSSHKICNYPSETEISGMDLAKKMLNHVEQLGATPVSSSVDRIEKNERGFRVVLSNNDVIEAKNILLATGTRHRRLGVTDEARFAGRGISYCATCDAAFFKNKTVAVVGGSDSANTAALYLAGIAARVYQIYRGKELRGETAWIEQIKQEPKIEIITETNIAAVFGEQKLSEVELDRPYGGKTRLSIDGLFVEIGSDPDGELIGQLGIATDEKGYVIVSSSQKTNIPGVWAAGDITNASDGFRQIVTAESEGAIAARSIFYDIKKATV